MKRFSRLILGVVVAVFLSQTSPSQAKTVTIRVGMTGDSFSSITPTQVLLNLSTRLLVETGEKVLIIGGTQDHEFIIRTIGPSLGAAGVADPLPDPTLELHDANGVLIASNDNWRDTQEAATIATGIAPIDDCESAIVMSLAAGNCTAIVRGANNGTSLAPGRGLPAAMRAALKPSTLKRAQ